MIGLLETRRWFVLLETAAETLVSLSVINAEGRLIIATIGATAGHRSRRRHDFESFEANPTVLMTRMAELAAPLAAPRTNISSGGVVG
jgi:hypothetical protein